MLRQVFSSCRGAWTGPVLHRLMTVGGLVLMAGLFSGCSTVSYLWQSARGHIGILRAAQPIDTWIDDSHTPEALRTRLVLARKMRDFAVQALHLPDNPSYRKYADLHRSAVIWNVAAAPELSLRLKTWCFPVVGCVAYRGYFDEGQAETEAKSLKAQGDEVTVYPVPAYSTLGMSNWLGGDPLLNTFIAWPEAQLARLIFHELAHQEVYVSGDTEFNESFATSVEELGADRWLDAEGATAARADYERLETRRQQFHALLIQTRDALQDIYASKASIEVQRQRKAQVMQDLRTRYQQLRDGDWGGWTGYDRFIAQANNASLGMQAAYTRWVPSFKELFRQQGSDFERFYGAVRVLAGQSPKEREARLTELALQARRDAACPASLPEPSHTSTQEHSSCQT
jgi:predicted aminopeptidase